MENTNKTVNRNNPFGDVKGEKFGGGSNHLKMETGEVIHGFIHVRIDKNVQLDKSNEPVDLFVAIHPETKSEIRMPASSVFRANATEAKLKEGDVYSVARMEDTKKKTGKGKGREMAVYAILVTQRKKK